MSKLYGLLGKFASWAVRLVPAWPTFAAAALLLSAAALLAVWLSARRAEKTDPSAMLKQT